MANLPRHSPPGSDDLRLSDHRLRVVVEQLHLDDLAVAQGGLFDEVGPLSVLRVPDAQRGRELFSDQVRGLTRCSNCHQADGIGIAVTLPLTSVPESVAALRQIATPQIETATAEGDTFPALVLNKNGAQPKLYDLTIPPPVLRTFAKGTVTFKSGSTWNHNTMLAPYNDQELESILTFLRAVTK